MHRKSFSSFHIFKRGEENGGGARTLPSKTKKMCHSGEGEWQQGKEPNAGSQGREVEFSKIKGQSEGDDSKSKKTDSTDEPERGGRQMQIPGYKVTWSSGFNAKHEQESSTDKLATDW